MRLTQSALTTGSADGGPAGAQHRPGRISLQATARERTPLPRKAMLADEIVAVYGITRSRMARRNVADLADELHARRPARGHHVQPDSPESWVTATRLARAMTRTLRVLPTDPRCLVQSLVLTSLLSARGITSTLVIGVQSEPAFAAHAWVEHAGRPLLPTNGFQDSRLLEI